MAIYHLDIRPVTRSTGRTATAAAAYRAGERIRDERTGALYDHSGREDVLHKEILLPSRLDRPDAGMEWARDRSSLWNTAERAERQGNSRVAREYQVALPAELSAGQRLALARNFSREIADRYDVAVDLAIHAPRPEGDPRNFHAHLLATTREVTPDGLGPKTGLDMEGGVRSELGLPPSRQEFRTLRARWAELTNGALREASVDARVDHRSLAEQGLDREPKPHIPIAAIAMERRGQRSAVADRIREGYRARVAAREETAARRPAPDTPPRDMDARRRQAVQDWLAYRASLKGGSRAAAAAGAPSHSTDEIRRRAVEAWRSLRARGAESQPSPSSRQDREAGADRERPAQGRDTPGLGEDLSG